MDPARRQQLTDVVAAKAGVDAACAARHLALHAHDVAAALRSIDLERYTLTQRLLKKYRHDPEDALQHVALAIAQQENIGTDSALRAERIAALAPPLACVMLLADWLAYVEWEGFDSALHANFDAVNALVQTDLGLPPLARELAAFEAQRPLLADALCAHIQRHMANFPA